MSALTYISFKHKCLSVFEGCKLSLCASWGVNKFIVLNFFGVKYES